MQVKKKTLEAPLGLSEMTARLPVIRVLTRPDQICEDRGVDGCQSPGNVPDTVAYRCIWEGV